MWKIYAIAITMDILAIATYMFIQYLILKMTGNWNDYK